MKTKIFIVGTKPKGNRDDIKIVIKDQYNEVDETHCKVILKGKKFYIEDLNSVNGTFINGQKIEDRTEVDRDAEIILGFNNKLSLHHQLINYVYDKINSNKTKSIIGTIILLIIFKMIFKLIFH